MHRCVVESSDHNFPFARYFPPLVSPILSVIRPHSLDHAFLSRFSTFRKNGERERERENVGWHRRVRIARWKPRFFWLSRSVRGFSRHLIVIVRVTRFSRRRGCLELASASVECSIFLTGDGQTIRFSQVGTLTAADIQLIFQLYQVTSIHLKALYLGSEVVEDNIVFCSRIWHTRKVIAIFEKELFTKRDLIFPISQMSKNLFGYGALSVDWIRDCVLEKIGLSPSKEIIPVREDPRWSRWKSVTDRSDAARKSIPIVDRLFRSSKHELFLVKPSVGSVFEKCSMTAWIGKYFNLDLKYFILWFHAIIYICIFLFFYIVNVLAWKRIFIKWILSLYYIPEKTYNNNHAANFLTHFFDDLLKYIAYWISV